MIKAKIEIIYEDTDLLVVNKPSGVSVTKDRAGDLQLTDILSEQYPSMNINELRLIHRLDKLTSGIMLLAKNFTAQSLFSVLFEKKLVKKTYLALVTGLVKKDKGTIVSRIRPDTRYPGKMQISTKDGKDAVTEWQLLADFGHLGLLAVSPVTGRTHQIRLHLKLADMPLAIDPLYGNSLPVLLSDLKPDYRIGKNQTEKSLIDRLTLHAYQLEFSQPLPDKPPFLIAALDRQFAAAFKMLTKHNPKGPDAFISKETFNKIINAEKIL